MGALYSQDLRDRMLAACDRGIRTVRLAGMFAVSPAGVRRIKQRRRELRGTGPRPCRGRTRFKIDRGRLDAISPSSTPAG